uniref:Uncharacterized protein n=1 Tax=Oryza rufipogon TaxID=4529 RepID=A0A0E0NXG1_ORYRU
MPQPDPASSPPPRPEPTSVPSAAAGVEVGPFRCHRHRRHALHRWLAPRSSLFLIGRADVLQSPSAAAELHRCRRLVVNYSPARLLQPWTTSAPQGSRALQLPSIFISLRTCVLVCTTSSIACLVALYRF